ncbi:MAG: hypothetical protein K9I34_05830, partial [Bacteroidales bacterium]|nr:hypothetical protein [Bacteroidales bacterium]
MIHFKNKSTNRFWGMLGLFVALLLPWVFGYYYISGIKAKNIATSVKLVNYNCSKDKAADHSKFDILQQDFPSPEAVTEACLSCHNTTGQEVMQSSHWNWTRDYVTKSGDTIQLGKKNILNNFCIGIQSNEPRCTSCHIGYGWKDQQFDFANEKKIDCLV